jgi:hypothetical protein
MSIPCAKALDRAGVEADVLDEERLSFLEAGLESLHLGPDEVGREHDVPADELRQARGDGLEAHLGIGLALGAAQVRGQDELGAAAQEVGDGGQRGFDALVVADGAVVIDGDVEVHPQEDGLALDVEVFDKPHARHLPIRRTKSTSRQE